LFCEIEEQENRYGIDYKVFRCYSEKSEKNSERSQQQHYPSDYEKSLRGFFYWPPNHIHDLINEKADYGNIESDDQKSEDKHADRSFLKVMKFDD
jgi:hypothetical protein